MTDISNVPVTQSRSIQSLFDRPLADPMGWIRSEIERLFDDFGRPTSGLFNAGTRALALMPALDMVEEEKSYRLTAELPGITEKDLEVSVSDGVLHISGEKKEEKERKEKGCMFSERRYGAFERHITIPSDVNPNAIKAQFKDGILTVTLNKDEKIEARTHKIAIEKA